MRRRLFQRFQQRIECLVGQHMHFVDQIDLVMLLRRCIFDALTQIADLVDPAVGSAVDLNHIHAFAARKALASRADTAGIAVFQHLLAVDGARQNARCGGLARAARPAEKIGMYEIPAGSSMAQHARDMRLADQVAEALRPPTPV